MKRLVLLSIVLCAIQTLCLAQSSIDYNAIAKTDDGFAVCGNGNRLVFLDNFGAKVSDVRLSKDYSLNDIAYCDETLLAVGDGGTLILLKNAEAEEIQFGEVNFTNVISRDGDFLLGVGQSIIRMTSELDFKDAAELKLDGSVSFLSSFEGGFLIGATDRNEIFTSKDGKSFDVLDFNKAYQSFYDSITITAVAASKSSVAIAGKSEDGKPLMFVSSDGTVWSQRELSYLVKGTPVMLESIPSGLVYDQDNDRMLLLCEDGIVFIVPNCSHCNALLTTGGEMLRDAGIYIGGLIAVGGNSFVYSSILRD